MAKCNCSHCVGGRSKREEYRHGGIDDFEDEVPYRKTPSKRSRRSKACKKSKTGEPCDFSERKVVGTAWGYDTKAKKYINKGYKYEIVCARCGRYSWRHYTWSF